MSHKWLALSPCLLVLPTVIACAGGLVWRERAPMPRPRTGYMGGVINGRLIIAGGSYWENDQKLRTPRVDLFDPSSNTWQAGAPLPEPFSTQPRSPSKTLCTYSAEEHRPRCAGMRWSFATGSGPRCPKRRFPNRDSTRWRLFAVD
jgi:hypothetical protein